MVLWSLVLKVMCLSITHFIILTPQISAHTELSDTFIFAQPPNANLCKHKEAPRLYIYIYIYI